MVALPFYSPDRDPTARLCEYGVRYDEFGPVYIEGANKSVLPFVVGMVDHCRWITAPFLGHISKVLIKRDYPLTADGGWVLRRSDLDDLCLNLVAATYIEGATESVASRDSPPGSYQDS